jgi:hypothetical protein
MLHTFQEILVCSFAYIVLVAIAYQPRATEEDAQPIEYFPKIEEEMDEAVFPTEDAIAVEDWDAIAQYDPQFCGMTAENVKKVIVERRPVAAFTAPVATAPTVDLSALGVREIYKLAAAAKIKGYKKISKAKLIALLS